MQRVAVFYFSGTGNTEIVAGMVRDEFIRWGFSVDLFRMVDILRTKSAINTANYDLIGIGNSVNGFGSPHIVYDFIKWMPRGQGKNVFIFKTAGGVAPQNYNASKRAVRMLSRKGYIVGYDRLFSIGSNWIVKFKDGVMAELYQTTRHKVILMCAEIAAGKKRALKTEFPLSLLIGAVTLFHDLGVRFLSKDYAVSASCNLCGKCVRNCPTRNIDVNKKGKIKFKSSCLWCMRCIYGCPQKAIRQRLLSFAVLPGGYDIQKTLENPDLSDQCPGHVPPFFQKYCQNDDL